MFTGLIQDVGTVLRGEGQGDRLLTIATHLPLGDVKLGASIACNGVCLTIIDIDKDTFRVQVSSETVTKSTAGDWREGTKVNLERSLQAGDELGGHFVLGHVDGVAMIMAREQDGDSLRFTVQPPPPLFRYIAPKGSVTLDGVSLTVNDVLASGFTVNIIPHTQQWTNLGTLQPGDRANMEVDMMARYLDRLLDARKIIAV